MKLHLIIAQFIGSHFGWETKLSKCWLAVEKVLRDTHQHTYVRNRWNTCRSTFLIRFRLVLAAAENSPGNSSMMLLLLRLLFLCSRSPWRLWHLFHLARRKDFIWKVGYRTFRNSFHSVQCFPLLFSIIASGDGVSGWSNFALTVWHALLNGNLIQLTLPPIFPGCKRQTDWLLFEFEGFLGNFNWRILSLIGRSELEFLSFCAQWRDYIWIYFDMKIKEINY